MNIIRAIINFFVRLIQWVVCSFLIIVVLVVLIASLYVKFYAKNLMEDSLSSAFNSKVYMETVSYQFPYSLLAKNVQLGEDIFAERIQAQFVPESLWKTKPIRIEWLLIENARYSYERKVNANALKFNVENIQAQAWGLTIPLTPGPVNFQFNGRLVQNKSPLDGSRVEGSGWVDWLKKDMEGTLQVIEPSGNAGLNALAVSKHNDMTVTGDLKLSSPLAGSVNIQTKEGDAAAAAGNAFLGSLSSLGIEASAQFSFKTKMDDFQISNIGFSGKVNAPDFSQMFTGELSPAGK